MEIEKLKESDLVISYDFKKATLIEDTIVGIKKEKVQKVIQLNVNNQLLEVAPDHKFYCPMIKGNWILAKNLPTNHFLLKDATELVRIDAVKEVEKEVEVYTLSIKNNHNFFVSQKNLLVHNFLLELGTIGAFLVTLEIEEVLIAAIGVCLYNKLTSKNKKPSLDEVLNYNSSNGSPDDDDPDDDPSVPDGVKKVVKEVAVGYITNAAANVIANFLGFKQTKDVSFNSMGKMVFRKGNTFISPDRTRHNGGFWKVFKNGQRSTFNWNLRNLIGK